MEETNILSLDLVIHQDDIQAQDYKATSKFSNTFIFHYKMMCTMNRKELSDCGCIHISLPDNRYILTYSLFFIMNSKEMSDNPATL